MSEKEYMDLLSLLQEKPKLTKPEQLVSSIIDSVEHLEKKKNRIMKLMIVSWLASAVAILLLGLFIVEQSTTLENKNNFIPNHYSGTHNEILNLPENNSSDRIRFYIKQKQEYRNERKSFYSVFINRVK